jgi:dinuclear metal center YbgI/SA1388 family protein
MQTQKIVKFLEEYLKTGDFQDHCHNGLQVEGVGEVDRIITGVSLSAELIEKAIEKKARMIIVHHGIFGDMIGSPPRITGVVKDRLRLLLENDINLLGYHLPLDAHPEIGNNISLCRLLDVVNPEKMDIGFAGSLKEAMSFFEFVKKVNEKLGTESYSLPVGPKEVRRVGIMSGGASPEYKLAKEMGCDTFVCGDICENVFWEAKEAGINIINAGHYNTEKLGIKNLGDLLAEKFGIDVIFVDIPCEV